MVEISIGQMARRTGLAVSAVRFYESEGLLTAARNRGGHRRFPKSEIRRASFILISQQLGFSLAEIREALSSLPNNRTPTPADWAVLSSRFRSKLDKRIEMLTQMRDKLDGCIGCGCLSLARCALYNPKDEASEQGPGPRYLIGEGVK